MGTGAPPRTAAALLLYPTGPCLRTTLKSNPFSYSVGTFSLAFRKGVVVVLRTIHYVVCPFTPDTPGRRRQQLRPLHSCATSGGAPFGRLPACSPAIPGLRVPAAPAAPAFPRAHGPLANSRFASSSGSYAPLARPCSGLPSAVVSAHPVLRLTRQDICVGVKKMPGLNNASGQSVSPRASADGEREESAFNFRQSLFGFHDWVSDRACLAFGFVLPLSGAAAAAGSAVRTSEANGHPLFLASCFPPSATPHGTGRLVRSHTSGLSCFCLLFPLSGGPEAGGLVRLCCSKPGIFVQSRRIVLPGKFTSGPTAEGSADAAGRRGGPGGPRCRGHPGWRCRGPTLPAQFGRGCRGATLQAANIRISAGEAESPTSVIFCSNGPPPGTRAQARSPTVAP